MTPREALARIAALEVHDPDDRGGDTYDADEVRAILAEVTPETGCTLDRDQAREEIDSLLAHNGIDVDDPNWESGIDGLVDRLAGCVRPVAGVTITPEEAEVALGWEALISSDRGPERTAEEQALVDRLEAAR